MYIVACGVKYMEKKPQNSIKEGEENEAMLSHATTSGQGRPQGSLTMNNLRVLTKLLLFYCELLIFPIGCL